MMRRINGLEKKVLAELPEDGTTKITWENGDPELDRAEHELHDRATAILQKHEVILDEIRYNLEHGLSEDPSLSVYLSPQDEKIVDASRKRLLYRMFQVFQNLAKILVYHDDKLGEYFFFSRFYWIVDEVQRHLDATNAEEAVFDSPGFFELCQGDQDRLLAPVYAAWPKNLYTPESWDEYTATHHPMKTHEEYEAEYKNRTSEQIAQDDIGEKEDMEREAADDALDQNYLKEKCPGCATKCEWFHKQEVKQP